MHNLSLCECSLVHFEQKIYGDMTLAHWTITIWIVFYLFGLFIYFSIVFLLLLLTKHRNKNQSSGNVVGVKEMAPREQQPEKKTICRKKNKNRPRNIHIHLNTHTRTHKYIDISMMCLNDTRTTKSHEPVHEDDTVVFHFCFDTFFFFRYFFSSYRQNSGVCVCVRVSVKIWMRM